MPLLEPSARKTRRPSQRLRPAPEVTSPKVSSRFQLRPPLKWAGGKRWLVPELLRDWQTYTDRRLVEPFCGGLAVVLGLNPERALLNDINPHLINFYDWLKRGLKFTLRMENNSTAYYAHRAKFNSLLSRGLAGTQEAATLFYYLNRTGYNGWTYTYDFEDRLINAVQGGTTIFSGSANLSEIAATAQGVEGRWTADTGSGCRESAQFSAVLL